MGRSAPSTLRRSGAVKRTGAPEINTVAVTDLGILASLSVAGLVAGEHKARATERGAADGIAPPTLRRLDQAVPPNDAACDGTDRRRRFALSARDEVG